MAPSMAAAGRAAAAEPSHITAAGDFAPLSFDCKHRGLCPFAGRSKPSMALYGTPAAPSSRWTSRHRRPLHLQPAAAARGLRPHAASSRPLMATSTSLPGPAAPSGALRVRTVFKVTADVDSPLYIL